MDISEIQEVPQPVETETGYLIRTGKPRGDTDVVSKFPLKGVQVTIGRALASNIILSDNRLSRTHAILTYKDSKWNIKDQSLNGMHVNGGLLGKNSERLLEHGDVIQLIPDKNDFVYRMEYKETVSSTDSRTRVNLNNENVERPLQSTSSAASTLTNRKTLGEKISSNQKNCDTTLTTSKITITEGKENNSKQQQKPAVIENEDKEPASTNITKDFNQMGLSPEADGTDCNNLVGQSSTGPRPRLIVIDQDDSGDDSDCVILEDYRELKRDPKVVQVPAPSASASPLKVNPPRTVTEPHDLLLLSAESKAALIQEVKSLRKALAGSTKSRQEEYDDLESKVKKLKLEIAEQKSREQCKTDLAHRFLELQCSNCQAQFIEPVRLYPCGHVTCGFCLKDKNKNNATLRCPQCDRVIEDQSNDVVLDNLISEGFTVMPENLLQERQERISRRSNS